MPRTVLFYESHSGFFDGAQHSLYLLLKHMHRERYQPVFAGPEEGPLTRRLDEAGIKTYVVPLNGQLGSYGGAILREGTLSKARMAASLLSYSWRVRKIFETEGVEAVHCNSIRSLLTVAPAAKVAGIPLIWHLRLNLEVGWWNRIARSLADRVIVVADSLRERFPGGPGSPEQFITVYNGLSLAGFVPGESRSQLRRELGVEPGWQSVGMTGMITPRKGQMDFLEAAEIVLRDHALTKFVIVGKANDDENRAYERRLREYVAARGLQRHVAFTGWRGDVARVLGALDLFVLPSLNEGLPRSILEAMAMGLPVVATDVGGNAELVQDGRTGLMVPSRNPVGLADAISRLLGDGDMARAMGEAGRHRIRKKFSLEAYVQGVEEVIETVLRKRSRAA